MQKYVRALAKNVGAKLKAFRKDQLGSITQMAGYSMLPIFLCAGVGMDMTRVNYTHQKFASSLDAAALAAAAAPLGKTTAELKIIAGKYVEQNFKDPDSVTITAFDLTNTATKVVVTGTARVKTSIMMVANTELLTLANARYVDISLSSEVIKSGSNVEVALVLDNTTSMAPNMTDLITASKDFIDKVVQTTQTPYYSKAAIIPYNMGVNLGALADAARGTIALGTSTTPGSQKFSFTNPSGSNKIFDVSTCVSERIGAEAYTDAPVATNPVGRAYPPGAANPCISATLLPLTSNITTLKSSINSMASGSSTAGQVGIAWGWYTLSPTFGLWSGPSVPAAYTDTTTRKVLVLMTDAEYNSTYCKGVITGNPTTSGSGGASDHINCAASNGSSYAQSKALCTAIKQKGIEVYTIEFKLDTSYQARVDLMNDCATDSNHRITASDAAGLAAAFTKIAGNINALRVSK